MAVPGVVCAAVTPTRAEPVCEGDANCGEPSGRDNLPPEAWERPDMQLGMDPDVCAGYKSPAQIARRLTEAWYGANMYCPVCPSDALAPAPANARVVDFICGRCSAQFELKAQRTPIGSKVVDAAYSSMVERVGSPAAPHFAFLHYDRDALRAVDLVLVPAHFLTLSVIEERPPLAPTARRGGWIGCNILIGKIPPDGRIPVVTGGSAAAPALVRQRWRRFDWLGASVGSAHGWTADVLRLVRGMGCSEFSLADAYAWEPELRALYPRNTHVRPKIRQQLQILRDRGVIRFLGHGRYRAVD